MKSKKCGERLTVYLCGEIDHCSAAGMRKEIEGMIADPKIKKLTLDFSDVSFMDSSGVGMIIGRYKSMISRGGTVTACALQPTVDRLFHMAGLHRIIVREDTGED